MQLDVVVVVLLTVLFVGVPLVEPDLREAVSLLVLVAIGTYPIQ